MPGVGCTRVCFPFLETASESRRAGMMHMGLEAAYVRRVKYQAREAMGGPVNVTLAGWTHPDLGAMQLLELYTVLYVSL